MAERLFGTRPGMADHRPLLLVAHTAPFTNLATFRYVNPIVYTVAETERDLQGILDLQKVNLPGHLSAEEALAEGFVTVKHDLELLRLMNTPYPHIVAKAGDTVIGYTLVMLNNLRGEIPILIPMFEQIDNTTYRGCLLGNTRYVVMGQVCIAKGFRGQGVFEELYREMGRRLGDTFTYIITEISKRNPRSIRAHEKVGFTSVHTYRSPDGENWKIMLWEPGSQPVPQIQIES